MTSPASGASTAVDLPGYAPVLRSGLGPARSEQGYYVGRVERNLYWVTDGVYQSAFLTTRDGAVLFDAPPSIGHNLRRAERTSPHLTTTHRSRASAYPGAGLTGELVAADALF